MEFLMQPFNSRTHKPQASENSIEQIDPKTPGWTRRSLFIIIDQVYYQRTQHTGKMEAQAKKLDAPCASPQSAMPG
ncbi:hypothetical protein TRIUR3_12651 [Triticum urartu]|uniref:Uncharacterized protein n=1 Tax=Triticum urartu TaxID=4572 RepID=M8AMM8_TRIUA|nr:hypothetical protein TRIUR3_12651 [Triticum urartu]